MEKLFHMALQYITDYPDLRVVLLHRLPRLDSIDRANLSREADMAMTRVWEENGRPVNIIKAACGKVQLCFFNYFI